MRHAGLVRILVIGVTCAAALITGVIGVGLAIETSVISPPALNVQVDSVTLVSFTLPHECPALQLCPIADQMHENYSYAIWPFISSDTSMPPHAIELARLPLRV